MMSKVTIVVPDSFCAVDGVGYSPVDVSSVSKDVHAVQWFDTEGWVEFVVTPEGVKPANQNIYSLESFQAVLDSWSAINEQHLNPPPPPPPTADQNKATAIAALTATDWTQIPSVSDPALSNPHLTNAAEFAVFRSVVREVAINPVAGEGVVPDTPSAVWA